MVVGGPLLYFLLLLGAAFTVNCITEVVASPTPKHSTAVSATTVLGSSEKYVVEQDTYTHWTNLEYKILVTGTKTHEQAYDKVERIFDVGSTIMWPPNDSPAVGRRFKAHCTKVVLTPSGDDTFTAVGHYDPID